MPNLYSQLRDLVGQRMDKLALSDLVGQLGAEPACMVDDSEERVLKFSRGGVTVAILKGTERVSWFSLHFQSRAVERGETTPYEGELPFKLVSTDKLDDIKRKIGVKPRTIELEGNPRGVDDYWSIYELSPVCLAFLFNSSDGTLRCLMVCALPESKPMHVDEKKFFNIGDVAGAPGMQRLLRIDTPEQARVMRQELEQMRTPDETMEQLLQKLFPDMPAIELERLSLRIDNLADA